MGECRRRDRAGSRPSAGCHSGCTAGIDPLCYHRSADRGPGCGLAFVAASQQALQVSLPDTAGKPYFDRILARLQDFRLITVREGDHVVIGNSTAAILAHARVSLDVGDLGWCKARAVATPHRATRGENGAMAG